MKVMTAMRIKPPRLPKMMAMIFSAGRVMFSCLDKAGSGSVKVKKVVMF